MEHKYITNEYFTNYHAKLIEHKKHGIEEFFMNYYASIIERYKVNCDDFAFIIHELQFFNNDLPLFKPLNTGNKKSWNPDKSCFYPSKSYEAVSYFTKHYNPTTESFYYSYGDYFGANIIMYTLFETICQTLLNQKIEKCTVDKLLHMYSVEHLLYFEHSTTSTMLMQHAVNALYKLSLNKIISQILLNYFHHWKILFNVQNPHTIVKDQILQHIPIKTFQTGSFDGGSIRCSYFLLINENSFPLISNILSMYNIRSLENISYNVYSTFYDILLQHLQVINTYICQKIPNVRIHMFGIHCDKNTEYISKDSEEMEIIEIYELEMDECT